VYRAIPLDMKVEADVDFLSGENLIFCHGWPYSPPDGEVPEPGWSLYASAVFNNHNPWHPVMPAVTAYIGRMSYLMRQASQPTRLPSLMPDGRRVGQLRAGAQLGDRNDGQLCDTGDDVCHPLGGL